MKWIKYYLFFRNMSHKKTLTKVFSDVFFVYKSFFHWNISKLLILLWTLFLGGIISTFFATVYFLWWESFSWFYTNLLAGKISQSLFWTAIIMLGYVAIVMTFSYNYSLLIKLYLSYQEREKPSYIQKSYFDYKIFGKHLLLSLVFLWIFLTFSVIWFLFLAVFVNIFGGRAEVLQIVMNNGINLFSIVSLGLVFVLVIIFSYLIYRFMFAYVELMREKNKDKSVANLLKKSWRHSKGISHIFSFLVLLLFVLILNLPFSYVSQYVDNKKTQIEKYWYLDFVVNEEKKELEWDFKEFYELASKKYGNIEKQKLQQTYSSYALFWNFMSIVKFFLITGLLPLVLTSFYLRILRKKTEWKY